MTPFPNLASVMTWWMKESKNRPVGVVVDFQELGLQRREIRLNRSGWIIGFPDAPRRQKEAGR